MESLSTQEFSVNSSSSLPKGKIELPRTGNVVSNFAAQLGAALHKEEIFERSGSIFVLNKDKTSLVPLSADMLRTWAEKHVVFYVRKYNKDTGDHSQVAKTVSKQDAAAVLVSSQFTHQLRTLEKLNLIPLPTCRANGTIELLAQGYDAESKVYTCSNLQLTEMPLAEARAYLEKLLGEFPFRDEISRSVAIAAMLTGFARGILPPGTLVPLFLYDANAEGAGKTLLVKIAVVPVAGECPLASMPKNEEELRKALDSACISANQFICFDNVKGQLASQALEGFLTSQVWSGRMLGSNATFSCPNHSVVFVTGNGCTLSPDMRRRALVCSLHSTVERSETRTFKNVWNRLN